ncbi:hypothetical protein CM318V1_1510085 [Carnobacterium maltaromaticum]|nr:crosslink repair DNA glycosylase YcaQ family protein [Carnobacterium maltaromaticum]KRN73155.1 hypothetical protein IV76_GL002268 [Carnobacterium maltaromaticum]MBC9809258.1 hypothetical protein [Carnobacterium maltaromaticum]CRH17406.1 hypothetical protein CM318V1_1510085 [Carnobacterium maltaromaticum]
MDNQEIRTLRLANQQISSTNFKKPEELVQYLGAMQAQEYAMAKWAIGLRIPNLTVQDVDAAIDAGKLFGCIYYAQPGILLYQRIVGGCWH